MDHQKTVVFLFIILLAACMMPLTAVGNIDRTYTIKPPSTVSHQYSIINVQPRLLFGGHNQKLYISTPLSLVNYYGNLTHSIGDNSDYAQFITPEAVAPIAESLLKVTDNLRNPDEQFADAVLGFVHQMSYNITDPKYPVETLATNRGDCVGLSLLTASIMEAGGLDVVLILYTGINPQHMNVGVYLPYTPNFHTAFESPTSVTYQNKTYWTAEATPEGNWKVGDQSQALANAEANIIPIDNAAQSHSLPPAAISASLNTKLVPSTITMNPSQQASSTDVNGERSISISGSITPAIPSQTVNIYIYTSTSYGESLNFLNAVTDIDGNYIFTWNFTSTGTYYITANWNGASNYACTDSQTVPIFVGPQSYYQFNSIGYNFIFGQAGLSEFATLAMQGANSFLTVPLGSEASLSYNFIVLPAGQTISNVPTTNVSVSASVQRLLMHNGKVMAVEIPAHNETVPLDVPQGFEPLMLPDDFNQTLDNQFSLILQNTAGNYSLNIKGLSQEDLSNMQTTATVTNATGNIKENVWYQITTTVNGNSASTSLSYENGILIQSASSQNMSNPAVLLLTNNEDTAIAFKNIAIQTPNTSPQPQTTQKPTSTPGNPNLALYVVIAILAAATIVAALYVKKVKKAAENSKTLP